MRRKVDIGVLNEETGCKRGVALHFRLVVAQRGIEEIHKLLRPGRDRVLHATDDLGESTDSGRAIAEGAVLFLKRRQDVNTAQEKENDREDCLRSIS